MTICLRLSRGFSAGLLAAGLAALPAGAATISELALPGADFSNSWAAPTVIGTGFDQVQGTGGANNYDILAFTGMAAGAQTVSLTFAAPSGIDWSYAAGGNVLYSTQPFRWGWDGMTAGVVSLGYAVPGAVIAVGILLPVGWLQARFPQAGTTALVTGTLFGLMYAYLVRFSAVALQSVEAGYARVPPSVDETARMLGASRRRLFAELHAPLLRRAGLAALLLVFVDVMKELPATLVLRPFNSDTLAVVAYQLARDERLGEAALPSLAIVVVGLLPVLLLSRSLRAERLSNS